MTAGSVALGKAQLRLIEQARGFIDDRAAGGIDVALDPQCYLNSWAACVGQARLRQLADGLRSATALLLQRARDAAWRLRLGSFGVAGEDLASDEFEDMIVSWAVPTDFAAGGEYRDRYFGLSSRDTPRVLWFLILLSGSAPARLPANVRLFHRPASAGVRPHRPARGGFSGTVTQAHDIAAAVERCLRAGSFAQILMPYEAQPFQHAINRAARAHDPKIATVGYLHSALPALPTDYLLRDGAPDKLLVHGSGQAEILTRQLGWPAQRLEIIDSLRYLRDAVVPFAGRILLPYAFENADFIVGRVAALLAAAPPGSMPRWEVRNHPVMANSARHLALARRLNAVIGGHADRTSDEPRVASQTLMIGATAAVIEALERGLDVVHLCSNPLFERHCADIWTRLDIEEIAANVYRYRLRERGAYIRLGATFGAADRLGLTKVMA